MARKVAIIASHGDLFTGYKVFNLATVAASTGDEVAIFFTFDGLKLIAKEANGQLLPPPGAEGAQEALAGKNMPSIPQLVGMARELGVKFIACEMSLDVMDVAPSDLVEGAELGGAAAFLAFAHEAGVTLTM